MTGGGGRDNLNGALLLCRARDWQAAEIGCCIGHFKFVASVIANLQGEAIQGTRMDCFTAFAMTG
jgi:hypothetical protein